MSVINTNTDSGHRTDTDHIKSVQEKIPGDRYLNAMAQFFSMLADPTRLKIVVALKTAELCVHEISETINLSASAVSHQLRLLKTAKLIRSRRAGKMIYYALDDDHISQLLSIANSHINEDK
jgi:DNA-binding transcriptional ArsR family regulator